MNVNQNTGRNYCISILRVLGMLFIILCHIASWLDIAFLIMAYIFFYSFLDFFMQIKK